MICFDLLPIFALLLRRVCALLPQDLPVEVGPSDLPILPLTPSSLRDLDELPVIHFTISRRGGPFESFAPGEEVANHKHLANVLLKIEDRFNLTRREVKGNKLVRKAKIRGVGGNDMGKLISEVAQDGRWYAKVKIGQPEQEIEMDLDMLTSDFYVLTTTSNKGSKYDDFFSQSHVRSSGVHPFPYCTAPTDTFLLPTLNAEYPFTFAYCRPPKQSTQTLGPSGCMLGLAPSSHLSQISTPSLLGQLFDNKVIERPVFSIMLINGQEGVLSIGGTAAKAVEMVVQQTKWELDRLAAPAINTSVDAEQTGNQVSEPGSSVIDIEKGIVETGDFIDSPTYSVADATMNDPQPEIPPDNSGTSALEVVEDTQKGENQLEGSAAADINLKDRLKDLLSKLPVSTDETNEDFENPDNELDRKVPHDGDSALGIVQKRDLSSSRLECSPISASDQTKPLAKRGHRAVSPTSNTLTERETDWKNSGRWSKVQGAEGFWQILLQGVWIDHSKILKNQPAVIDINTPFILAPPLAAKAFYASVSGSFPLPPPMQGFYAFPCLNPPVVAFEFDGWQFPALQGGKGSDWFGMPGGRFSLGRLKEGSGYCVGAVVETRMGIGGGREDELAGNGMRDVWVIGEGFFRGVGGVFDFREQKVGFRIY